MNKLLNSLVFLNVLSLYFCANITFKATKINEDLDLNCPYTFDKDESLIEFSYLRDGIVFYNYTKSNENSE